ncbi:CHAP domain-containing protein [Nonomuraea sp. NPDC049709]|uniref:CHAP domain-containing protein n=1 Tax=Nonomuraea sp. NPDC049709 TaxID=3154736 RepID=UPI00342ACE8A
MTAAARMLAEARRDLGMAGRPNAITKDYASRNGAEFLRAPWCDMSVTHWARQSGNADVVLPRGDRAYTVWHAQDGERLGRWYKGTAANLREHARPGAIVFFDWAGRDDIDAIDHVGIVEKNLGDGRVQTIEGNTADACKRRVRASNVIAGFWNPDYPEEDDVDVNDVWHKAKVRVNKGQEGEKDISPAAYLQEIETEQDRIKSKLDALSDKLDQVLARLG